MKTGQKGRERETRRENVGLRCEMERGEVNGRREEDNFLRGEEQGKREGWWTKQGRRGGGLDYIGEEIYDRGKEGSVGSVFGCDEGKLLKQLALQFGMTALPDGGTASAATATAGGDCNDGWTMCCCYCCC